MIAETRSEGKNGICQWSWKPCEALLVFSDFETFRNSEEVSVGKEFAPSGDWLESTEELTEIFWRLFSDQFVPHIGNGGGSPSFLDLLTGSSDSGNTYLHGTWTLSFLNAFIRRLFGFLDGTEIITPWFGKVVFPAPNPSKGHMSCTFRILRKIPVSIKIADGSERDAMEFVFDAELRNDATPVIKNERAPRPVCVAEWKIIYVAPGTK